LPGLLIKNFPPNLHRRLRESARRHHRSMNREALALLEHALNVPQRPGRLPPLVELDVPLTDAFLGEARRMGRE
jgi:plasmid stability protein